MLIMAVSTRLLMRLATDPEPPSRAEPQFKQALISLAQEAAVLTPHCPQLALVIFSELLHEMARVLYYRPKVPRPSQPRVCKNPSINGKWSDPNEWRGLKSTALCAKKSSGAQERTLEADVKEGKGTQ
jgi:hypothetical protein